MTPLTPLTPFRSAITGIAITISLLIYFHPLATIPPFSSTHSQFPEQPQPPPKMSSPDLSSKETHTAFFYGILMVPQVLHRVCHGGMQPNNTIYTSSNFTVRPALLHNYRRAKVYMADYPGITASPSSTVRGTVVTGLTVGDIWRLDIFEGDEYTREKVKVRVLTTVGDDDGEGNVEGEEVEAQTYVFKEEVVWRLLDDEWDFAAFKKDKMKDWVGEDEGFAEVDAAVAAVEKEGKQDGTGGRGVNGHIGRALNEEHKKDEETNKKGD